MVPRVVLVCLLLAGCSQSSTGRDGSVMLTDGGTAEDEDGDFLCDQREVQIGTDPAVRDSDADGFSDWAEYVFGFDPLLPAEPDRSLVFVMREGPMTSIQVEIEQMVRGEGEDFTGAFEPLPAYDLAGVTASDFYAGSISLFANPPDNVAVVEEETFRGVFGSTLLGFQVRFAFGDNLPRDCIRAYPYRYTVKRSDGTVVGSFRHLLVILPMGELLTTGQWCAPIGDRCML